MNAKEIGGGNEFARSSEWNTAETRDASIPTDKEFGIDVATAGHTQAENETNATGVIAGKRGPGANDLASVPDGGLTAWLQAVGSFFLFFNTWGLVNMFGVYQTIYQEDILPSSTSSSISWIGSIQAFLLLLVGALTGPMYDAGHFRFLLTFGSSLLVFGLMMLSICKEYWQILLAQGFAVGLGAGLLFIPSVAILSTYFTTKLATATGVGASGSSLGGVIYPILLHKLLPQVGFGWANRIIGFIVLATLAIPNLVMRMRTMPPARRKLTDLGAFKEIPYSAFVGGSFLGFLGLYPPLFYVQLYCIQRGMASRELALYLLSILNTGSVFGRLLPNFVADRTGPLNIIVPCTIMAGVLSLCLMAIDSYAAVATFCVLYGFFSGSLVSLPATVIVSLTEDRHYVGTRMGMAFAVMSVGLLIGSPIAGAILDHGGYNGVWAFSGASIITGALTMGLARVAKLGWKLNVRG